jgi:niacin transporter
MSNDQKKRPGTERNQTWIRKITYGGLLLAIGIVLPQVFHLTGGPTSGATFLPMHIPVLIAGLLLGPAYGLIIGVVTPFLSFLITGMPVVARLPFMVVELTVYGLVAGLCYHTLGFSRFRFPGRSEICETREQSDTRAECLVVDGTSRIGFTNAERLLGIYLSLILAMVIGRFVYALSLLIMSRLFGLEKADPAAVLTAIMTGIVGIVIQLVIIPPILFALQKGGLTDGLSKRGRSKT